MNWVFLSKSQGRDEGGMRRVEGTWSGRLHGSFSNRREPSRGKETEHLSVGLLTQTSGSISRPTAYFMGFYSLVLSKIQLRVWWVSFLIFPLGYLLKWANATIVLFQRSRTINWKSVMWVVFETETGTFNSYGGKCKTQKGCIILKWGFY